MQLEQKPTRPSIATQILAVLILVAMVTMTFTTERKDKAWKAAVKQLGLDKVEQADPKKSK